MSAYRKVFTLTIPDGAAESNVVDLDDAVPFADPAGFTSIFIKTPSIATVVTLHAAASIGGTFGAYQTGTPGVDITLTSGKSMSLANTAIGCIKLVSTGNVTGAKVFEVLAK